PLVPQASCDLAVELALRSLGDEPPEPGLRLIAPMYVSRGSVAVAKGAAAADPSSPRPAPPRERVL
ncbi:MAG TPA: hypothetical protein VEX12_08665, partial [Microbacterium sp.]|nr:hypothetical protein [Microbacterium sp.]